MGEIEVEGEVEMIKRERRKGKEGRAKEEDEGSEMLGGGSEEGSVMW